MAIEIKNRFSGEVIRTVEADNLSRANLTGANLSDADLSRADLTGADLTGADLTGADLTRAYLSRANLSRADLTGAILSGADLTGAILSRADLRSFEADLWMTLTQNRAEVPALIRALREGRVDGSCYTGECACLVGTIANARGVNAHTLDHDARRPAEQWFAMISPGDQPDDATGGGFATRMALEWSLAWCACNGIDPDAVETAGAPL